MNFQDSTSVAWGQKLLKHSILFTSLRADLEVADKTLTLESLVSQFESHSAFLGWKRMPRSNRRSTVDHVNYKPCIRSRVLHWWLQPNNDDGFNMGVIYRYTDPLSLELKTFEEMIELVNFVAADAFEVSYHRGHGPNSMMHQVQTMLESSTELQALYIKSISDRQICFEIFTAKEPDFFATINISYKDYGMLTISGEIERDEMPDILIPETEMFDLQQVVHHISNIRNSLLKGEFITAAQVQTDAAEEHPALIAVLNAFPGFSSANGTLYPRIAFALFIHPVSEEYVLRIEHGPENNITASEIHRYATLDQLKSDAYIQIQSCKQLYMHRRRSPEQTRLR